MNYKQMLPNLAIGQHKRITQYSRRHHSQGVLFSCKDKGTPHCKPGFTNCATHGTPEVTKLSVYKPHSLRPTQHLHRPDAGVLLLAARTH